MQQRDSGGGIAPAPLQVEFVSSFAALERHRCAYHALLRNVPGPVAHAMSIEALQCLDEAYRAPRESVAFLLAWQGDALAAVAPLLSDHKRFTRLRRLHAWGTIRGPLGIDADFLFVDDAAVVPSLQAFRSFLCSAGSGHFDVLELESLRATSPLAREWRGVFPEARPVPDRGQTYLVDLPRTVAEYRASLDTAMLKDMRRNARTLAATGRVELLTVERLTADELEQVARLHGERQDQVAGASSDERYRIFADPAQRRAYANWLELNARLGAARHYLLKVDGAVVAFLLCHATDGVLVAHTTAFARSHARHGPGRMIMLGMIEREIERGLVRCVDLGKGTTKIKQDFANRTLAHTGFVLVNPAAALSRVKLGLDALRGRAARAARAWRGSRSASAG